MFTQDIDLALALADELDAGSVIINGSNAWRIDTMPFGGTGKSGYGREMGFAAMDEYTTKKSVWINVDATLPDWYAR